MNTTLGGGFDEWPLLVTGGGRGGMKNVHTNGTVGMSSVIALAQVGSV